ncbi:MAG: hypothetical protein IPL55_07125 [Saprospiraceae bacterium]|jgi:hypothetical protein|nr:hypothetical protein [Saprospiraceae bacterium]MBL0027514.1 hypothetical protein [Saprospiraceae bacterium]
MDHSDDQSDFAPDDDLLMHQEIMLLKMKAFHNSSMAQAEYEILEKEIRAKFAFRHNSYDY